MRIIAIVAIAVAALLVASGAVEVKLHVDRLKDVPGYVTKIATDPAVRGKARIWFVNAKRDGEQWLANKDEQKKLKLALIYVAEDADSLAKNLEDGSKEAKRTQDAQLLLKSLERASTLLAKAPVETLAENREEGQETLGKAKDSLLKFAELEGTAQEAGEQVNNVIATIEKYVGELPGIVAGTQDKKE